MQAKFLAVSACAIILSAFQIGARGQTSVGGAFTYQGRLVKDGIPVDAACDFEFSLWDQDAPGGNQIGLTQGSLPQIVVADGLFTANLDFGPGVIDGNARWLEITVRCPGDAMPVTLIPRQKLTPAPYAFRAVEGVGEVLHVTPAGNVGIGTLSPTSRLHIKDNNTFVELESNNAIGDIPLVFLNAADNQNWQLRYNGANQKSLTILDGTNGAYRTTWLPNGNVGIGVDTPVNKLDVSGNMSIGAPYSGTNSAPSNGLLVAGNVGIGTTTPESKLDVEGGAAIGASYSGTTSAPTNGLIVEGNVGIGTTTPQEKLHIHGGHLRLNPDGTNYGHFCRGLNVNVHQSNGRAGVAVHTAFSGVAYLGFSSLMLDGKDMMIIGTDFTTNDIGFFTDLGSMENFDNLAISGKNPVMLIKGTGNVGIGTTTPASKLDVEGSATIGAAYSGTSAAPTNGLIVEGNVGVGTTSPAKKLDVRGSLGAGASGAEFVVDTSGKISSPSVQTASLEDRAVTSEKAALTALHADAGCCVTPPGGLQLDLQVSIPPSSVPRCAIAIASARATPLIDQGNARISLQLDGTPGPAYRAARLALNYDGVLATNWRFAIPGDGASHTVYLLIGGQGADVYFSERSLEVLLVAQ